MYDDIEVAVERSNTKIFSDIDALHVEIDKLEKKLSPILLQSTPETAKSADMQSKTDLDERITGVIGRLRYLSDRIKI